MPATPEAVALLVMPSTPSETAFVPVLVPVIAAFEPEVEPTIATPAGLEAVRVTDVMLPAANEPVPSRFTMAFAVSALVGATFQFSARVPLPVTGEPLTVKSETGALSPTLVTVPVPGKVWVGANVNTPVLLSFNPISVGWLGSVPYSRFSVALGDVVLLPTGSACH